MISDLPLNMVRYVSVSVLVNQRLWKRFSWQHDHNNLSKWIDAYFLHVVASNIDSPSRLVFQIFVNPSGAEIRIFRKNLGNNMPTGAQVPSQYKDGFLGYGISIIKIRRSWDRPIFIKGIPMLVRHIFLYFLKTILHMHGWICKLYWGLWSVLSKAKLIHHLVGILVGCGKHCRYNIFQAKIQ